MKPLRNVVFQPNRRFRASKRQNRMEPCRRCGRGERGQDMIEYALILPLLLLILFGIIDFAIVIFSYNTIANAAREGARAGIIYNTSEADVEAAAEQLTVGLKDVEIKVDGAPCTNLGDTVKVTVNYTPTLVTGRLTLGRTSIPLHTVTTMQCE